MASIIIDIPVISKFYVASVREDADDAYKRDVLKAIF